MFETIIEQFRLLLGIEHSADDLGAVETVLRTVFVYAFTLAIVRLGSKRFLSKATAFDVIVGIMLGSIMSRAITDSSAFFPTLAAGSMLVAIHWLLAFLAFHTDWFGSWIKGEAVLLVEDGQIQEQGMRQSGVSLKDLEQAIRINTNQTDPAHVRRAYLERDGSISVLPMKSEPRVLDVSVKDGVQTVRIELS
jgi:uncharacterized membrane protein YcaP (DUF421 family)